MGCLRDFKDNVAQTFPLISNSCDLFLVQPLYTVGTIVFGFLELRTTYSFRFFGSFVFFTNQ